MKYPQLVSMPSAVSDWLEEQLEARGIDAVVYTRYVLSLLHSHTVDVINSDEDLHFSHLKKEVRGTGGSRKRFRRTSDWWRYADVEQLKRSAAVKCLMSASDQNCEIESLVDELCEKLKEIKNEAISETPQPPSTKPIESQPVTPQELAAKYYAAFPPLDRSSSPSKLISLIPKWIHPSPKKKPIRKNNKVQSDNMKAKHSGKRFGGYFAKNKKDLSLCRNVAKSVEKADNATNWDLCSFNNNTKIKMHSRQIEDNLNDDEEMNMYEDLPVDIRELLDSPSPPEVEYMNLANMRDDGKRGGFISCGTNIMTSIWSKEATFDDNFSNSELEATDSLLDFKFSSISINNAKWQQQQDNCFLTQNETNSFFEEHDLNHLTESLMKLNHDKNCSGFSQVLPKTPARFNPFGSRSSSLFSFNHLKPEPEKDDLLTSERTHFKPINEKADNRVPGQYVDGSTFIISNNLDKINYKRSDSGSLFVESESGSNKKYQEYRVENANGKPDEDEFVLKFNVCQNNMACQTDDCLNVQESTDTLNDIVDETCECNSFLKPTPAMDNDNDKYLTERPESMLDEVMWRYEANKSCEKCNNNNNDDWSRSDEIDAKWDNQKLRNIWSGVEVCNSCATSNGGRAPPTFQQSQLREDISQDGEQLLSDLSSLQKLYMEEEEEDELPIAEVSCDLNELMMTASAAPPKERKRRHSFIAAAHVDAEELQSRSSWSFASRLEEDCLIQMATLPTLRSVTL